MLYEKISPLTHFVEWYNKPSIKRKMKERAYDVLESSGIADDDISKIFDKILPLLTRDNL